MAGCGRPRRLPLGQIRLEAPLLFGRIGQLHIAIGQLHALGIQLEAQRSARIRGIQLRQRGLRGREVVQAGEPAAAKRRPDPRGDQEIQQFVARGAGEAAGGKAMRARASSRQFLRSRPRADRSPARARRPARSSGIRPAGLACPPALSSAPASAAVSAMIAVQLHAQPIPLDHGELGVVQSARPRQRGIHGRSGRCRRCRRPAAASSRYSGEVCRKRGAGPASASDSSCTSVTVARQRHRGFHFEHAALAEEARVPRRSSPARWRRAARLAAGRQSRAVQAGRAPLRSSPSRCPSRMVVPLAIGSQLRRVAARTAG